MPASRFSPIVDRHHHDPWDFHPQQVEPDCGLVNGHKGAVNSIAFSPFKPNVMATGDPCLGSGEGLAWSGVWKRGFT